MGAGQASKEGRGIVEQWWSETERRALNRIKEDHGRERERGRDGEWENIFFRKRDLNISPEHTDGKKITYDRKI